MRLTQWCNQGFQSSRVWCCVVADVSGKCDACTFKRLAVKKECILLQPLVA